MKYRLIRGVGQARAKFPVGTTSKYLPFATMKEINLGITAEDARQTGGDQLFPLDVFTTQKSGRVRITDAQLNMTVLEMMGAGTAATSANFLVFEILTVASNQVTTNAAIVSDAVAGTDTISILDEDGNPVTSYTHASGTKVIGGLSAQEGTRIKVYYETSDCTNITSYALKVNDEPVYFELIQSARYRDPEDNTIGLFQIRIYRLRLIGNLEFTFRHGEFSAPVIEAEILSPGRVDGKVLEYSLGTQPAALVQS